MATVVLAEAVVQLGLDDKKYRSQVAVLGRHMNNFSNVITKALVAPGLAIAVAGIAKYMRTASAHTSGFVAAVTGLRLSFGHLLARIGRVTVEHFKLVKVFEFLKKVMDGISDRQIRVFLDVVRWGAILAIFTKIYALVLRTAAAWASMKAAHMTIAGASAAGAAGQAAPGLIKWISSTAIGAAIGTHVSKAFAPMMIVIRTIPAQMKAIPTFLKGIPNTGIGATVVRQMANMGLIGGMKQGRMAQFAYSGIIPPDWIDGLRGFTQAGLRLLVVFTAIQAVWRGLLKSMDISSFSDAFKIASDQIGEIVDVVGRVSAAFALLGNVFDFAIIEPISNVINVLMRLQKVLLAMLQDVIFFVKDIMSGGSKNRTKDAWGEFLKGIEDSGLGGPGYTKIFNDMLQNWRKIMGEPQRGGGPLGSVGEGRSGIGIADLNKFFQDFYNQNSSLYIQRKIADNAVKQTTLQQGILAGIEKMAGAIYSGGPMSSRPNTYSGGGVNTVFQASAWVGSDVALNDPIWQSTSAPKKNKTSLMEIY